MVRELRVLYQSSRIGEEIKPKIRRMAMFMEMLRVYCKWNG